MIPLGGSLACAQLGSSADPCWGSPVFCGQCSSMGPHVFLPAHPHGGRSPRAAGEDKPQGAITFQASVHNC